MSQDQGEGAAGAPLAARVGRLERWLRRRREIRMMRLYGGIQWCPWCKQCAQESNADWRFDAFAGDPGLDVLTCGVCRGRSLWLWGMGMHFIRALDHPAQEIEARGDSGCAQPSSSSSPSITGEG